MIDPLQEKLGDWMGAVLVLPAICGEIFWSASILGALGQTPFCLTIIHCIAKCCLPYCMLKLMRPCLDRLELLIQYFSQKVFLV